MKFSELIRDQFDTQSLIRGREYFLQGRVRLLPDEGGVLEARVRGSRMYTVFVDQSSDGVDASCDCPRFDDWGSCKHIWATILAAEREGRLGPSMESRSNHSGAPLLPLFENKPEPPPEPNWKKVLAGLRRQPDPRPMRGEAWSASRQVLYYFSGSTEPRPGSLVARLFYRDRKQNGDWAKPKSLRLTRSILDAVCDPQDREILTALAGSSIGSSYSTPLGEYSGFSETVFYLLPTAALSLLPRMCEAGRAFLQTGFKEEAIPLAWDAAGPWEFALELVKEKRRWLLRGGFRRGEGKMAVTEPVLIAEGMLFTRQLAAQLAPHTAQRWLDYLRKGGQLDAFLGQEEELLAELLADPHLPPLIVPSELSYQRTAGEPKPVFRIQKQDPRYATNTNLLGTVLFDYNGRLLSSEDPLGGIYDKENRAMMVRNPEREAELAAAVAGLGLRQGRMYYDGLSYWLVPATRLPKIVRALAPQGWSIEAEGKLIRRAGDARVEVTTGIDWFELHATVDFDGLQATLPELLRALRRGDAMVRLGDGSYGMLPEEWLKRMGAIPEYGTEAEDHIRFKRNQLGLLDALLAAQPEIGCDRVFTQARQELVRFEGVKRGEQPDTFQGELRGYQLDGLGWMHFLRQFRFGGCLADDMGVGKTPQVLALLETRRLQRAAGESVAPSLVVVPRSLVFNWMQEAARFTPRLRVLDHTGAGRSAELFDETDVILTTYGTLRRDAAEFKDFRFDYVILDEAQAIKNAATESSKAARLLQADYRLALSGTPVENHLGELWSLFEFLNPGMLGGASVLRNAGTATRNLDEHSRRVLARALRPFILRRTKEQVAPELPLKVEQTLVCELEPEQRKLYNELREHYRSSLLHKLTAAGLKRSKIQVLEALLRLRQAACHPGLIDDRRRGESSAKLDLLQLQLDDVMQEGRKAIIFSQFTSFLSILRTRLNADKVPYEYLDGATRDRESCVNRFQNDPQCRLFLISLKAGGLGLNLTAAEYVFLLDPWWNPAAEAQAIDRAHRIGQLRQVFAYRLIARDTVEEKILELQKTKRDLADAIISADNSIIGNLGREELEMLLS